MKDFKIIAVDFDGTLCENAWPDIGKPNYEMLAYIKNQQRQGAKIILWTCREGLKLDEALIWCSGHGLRFDAVNRNVPEIIEAFGGDCRKIYADVYIDDLSFNHTGLIVPIRNTLLTVMEYYRDNGYNITLSEKENNVTEITVVRRKDGLKQTVFTRHADCSEKTIEDRIIEGIHLCVDIIRGKEEANGSNEKTNLNG